MPRVKTEKKTYTAWWWNGDKWVQLASIGSPSGFGPVTFDSYADALLFCRRAIKKKPGDYKIECVEDGRDWPVR